MKRILSAITAAIIFAATATAAIIGEWKIIPAFVIISGTDIRL